MNSKPIPLLYLMDGFYRAEAGTENQLLQLINALDRRRVDPRLTVFRQTPYLRDNPFPCHLEVLNITKLLRVRTLLRLVRLSSKIRRDRIEIVHILLNDASIIAPLFCKLGGAKVVVSRRDMGFWYTRTNLAILRFNQLFVDAAVANSRAVRDNIIVREGFHPKKVHVIYNGHDPARFSKPPAADFRATYGIGPDDPVIGMVASLYPIKRHPDLLNAFAIVRQRFPRAHLVLAGRGSDEEQTCLQHLAQSLGIQQYVHFLGLVPDAIPIIRCFDVCVLCSDSEGLSNAVIEYMGCGKPTVCTNVGGTFELIDDGQTGFLINIGDVPALVKRVITLLENPALAVRLGGKARAKVPRVFSLDKMVNSHTALYEALATGVSTQ